MNDRWRRRLHDTIRAVEDAVAEKKTKDAETAYLKAESIIDRVARRNIIHPNTASRKKSRLRTAINKIAAK